MGVVAFVDPHLGSRTETIEALESLLAEAKAGHLIGLAYVGMYRFPGSEYAVGIAGETKRSPTLTRGMLLLLDDNLSDLLSKP